ncbi:hypothetical protein GGR57DRAFT_191812 [Xylariaceae sp. FL1272]|nr:hypothetical protein GGR57DRAFT_191812 [Xylariaceae sp. FL1272]
MVCSSKPDCVSARATKHSVVLKANPHHKWPSVRDRILLLLSLPDEARPVIATGPLAIVQLAYDLQDASEGARIWGSDPCMRTFPFWMILSQDLRALDILWETAELMYS